MPLHEIGQKTPPRLSGLALLYFVFGVAAVGRLYREALANSNDFAVYYRGVVAWLQGASPYAIRPEWEGFVFKYPPWAIPPLFWIGLMSFPVASVAWLSLCLGIIGLSIRWVIAQGVSWRMACGSAFLFWWIWLAHASAGQFTMMLLGAGVVGYELPRTRVYHWARATLLTLTFGAKIFSLATLLGVSKRLLQPQPLLGIASALAVLHLTYFGVSAIVGGSLSLTGVYSDWARAAASGSKELGAEIVRGQGNHGFCAAILRILDPLARHTEWDLIVFGVLTACLGMLWSRFSRRLNAAEVWAGWLALGVVVLPLAWHHSFVVAYPLCALTLDRATRTRSPLLTLSALLGTACIGIFIPQVIGKTWVRPLELCAIKSWGVVISGATLVASKLRMMEKAR